MFSGKIWLRVLKCGLKNKSVIVPRLLDRKMTKQDWFQTILKGCCQGFGWFCMNSCFMVISVIHGYINFLITLVNLVNLGD